MENEALKPKLTKTDKLDATTEAAYEIIDRQISEREKKTALLKQMRLTRDAATVASTSPQRRTRRTDATKVS